MAWLQRSRVLVGDEGLQALHHLNVLLVGLGGVGSFVAEFLCRAGVGQMTIVDADTVDVSNKNRQLPALTSTVDCYKVDVMATRLLDINPQLRLNPLRAFLMPEGPGGPEELLAAANYDYVVDCIDSLAPKINLIAAARHRGIKVVSSMGAGGRMDPTRVRVADLSETVNDAFAARIRKRLRKHGISTGVSAAFSDELASSSSLVLTDSGSFKRSYFGTISFMPALFGIHIAAHIINETVAGCKAQKQVTASSSRNAAAETTGVRHVRRGEEHGTQIGNEATGAWGQPQERLNKRQRRQQRRRNRRAALLGDEVAVASASDAAPAVADDSGEHAGAAHVAQEPAAPAITHNVTLNAVSAANQLPQHAPAAPGECCDEGRVQHEPQDRKGSGLAPASAQPFCTPAAPASNRMDPSPALLHVLGARQVAGPSPLHVGTGGPDLSTEHVPPATPKSPDLALHGPPGVPASPAMSHAGVETCASPSSMPRMEEFSTASSRESMQAGSGTDANVAQVRSNQLIQDNGVDRADCVPLAPGQDNASAVGVAGSAAHKRWPRFDDVVGVGMGMDGTGL